MESPSYSNKEGNCLLQSTESQSTPTIGLNRLLTMRMMLNDTTLRFTDKQKQLLLRMCQETRSRGLTDSFRKETRVKS